MFFEEMTPTHKKSAAKAMKVSFVFFLVALLGHTLYSFFFLPELSASFWILISGSLVYSMSNFFFRKREERTDHE